MASDATVTTIRPLQSSGGTIASSSLGETLESASSIVPGTFIPAIAHDLVLYEKQEQIGKGSFGVVHKVRRSTDRQLFAAKIAFVEKAPDPRTKVVFDIRAKEARRQLEDEIRNLQVFSHENIIKVVDVSYLDLEGPQMIMPLFDGHAEDMFGWDVPQMVVLDIFTDICGALNHIHEKGYVHMDVKPQNILVRRGRAASDRFTFHLCDFGGLLTSDDEIKPIRARTRMYASPEVLAWSGRYTSASDIWSLMVTVMVLLNEESISEVLNCDQFDIEIIGTVVSKMKASERLADFEDCVATRAADRPTAAQCLARINSGQHSFHDLEDLILA